MRGNPITRVWEEVYVHYKEVSTEHRLKVSDLLSIVLMYSPVLCPLAVIEGLKDNYDIPEEEAVEIAMELAGRLKKLVIEEKQVPIPFLR